jgi:hypothetical protein
VPGFFVESLKKEPASSVGSIAPQELDTRLRGSRTHLLNGMPLLSQRVVSNLFVSEPAESNDCRKQIIRICCSTRFDGDFFTRELQTRSPLLRGRIAGYRCRA